MSEWDTVKRLGAWGRGRWGGGVSDVFSERDKSVYVRVCVCVWSTSTNKRHLKSAQEKMVTFLRLLKTCRASYWWAGRVQTTLLWCCFHSDCIEIAQCDGDREKPPTQPDIPEWRFRGSRPAETHLDHPGSAFLCAPFSLFPGGWTSCVVNTPFTVSFGILFRHLWGSWLFHLFQPNSWEASSGRTCSSERAIFTQRTETTEEHGQQSWWWVTASTILLLYL